MTQQEMQLLQQLPLLAPSSVALLLEQEVQQEQAELMVQVLPMVRLGPVTQLIVVALLLEASLTLEQPVCWWPELAFHAATEAKRLRKRPVASSTNYLEDLWHSRKQQLWPVQLLRLRELWQHRLTVLAKSELPEMQLLVALPSEELLAVEAEQQELCPW